MKKVVVFDMQGKFLGAVERHGSGPEEYLNIADMNVTPEQNIEILDNVQSQINT